MMVTVIRIGFFVQITSCEYSTLELVCCNVHGNHVHCILDSKFGVLEGLILLCIIKVTCHLGLRSKINEGANHSKYFQYLLFLVEEHVYYTYT